jgi:hypothetical protein
MPLLKPPVPVEAVEPLVEAFALFLQPHWLPTPAVPLVGVPLGPVAEFVPAAAASAWW